MMCVFQKITEFPRGTLSAMLADAYSFDPRCAETWTDDWHQFDDFFFDNPHLAERYGFMTSINGEPIGFVTWDPRHFPESVQIGHNCIRSKYKHQGYGTFQMREAIRRILLDKPHKIIVSTNARLTPAQKMYERSGFMKVAEIPNPQILGNTIHYELIADVEPLALQRMDEAHEVIRLSRVREAWESIGAKINQVGSMSMGLLMKHRDIDFHIYTDSLDPAESLKAISQICANSNVTRMEYRNLAATQEACLEWHIWFNLNGGEWQIDMIQILAGSQFDGYFEHVAARINNVMTPDMRRNILELKYLTPDCEHIMGILYYQAVIADGVRSYNEFSVWLKSHQVKGINLWHP